MTKVRVKIGVCLSLSGLGFICPLYTLIISISIFYDFYVIKKNKKNINKDVYKEKGIRGNYLSLVIGSGKIFSAGAP